MRTSTGRLLVLSDSDGVVSDLVSALCDDLANAGKCKTPHDIKHYDFSLSCTQAEVKIMRDSMALAGFAYRIPWYKGAFDFVAELNDDKDIELLFVTSPYESSPTWIDGRKAMLAAAGIPRTSVLNINSKWKHLVNGDVLIEDHPGTLHDWLEQNQNGFGILFDRPWNRSTANEFPAGFEKHERMERASSYEDVKNILKVLKNLKKHCPAMAMAAAA